MQCLIHPSYPTDCHLIIRLSLLRLSSVQRWEHRRLHAITAVSGKSLRRKQSAKEQRREMEKLGPRKVECGSKYLPARFYPLYPTRATFAKSIMCGTWCPHPRRV
jgi:hypothetical protein